MTPVVRVLLAIDAALEDADAFEIDRLIAARQCLIETTVPMRGASTKRKAARRAFAKWCPGCERARPGHAFNRNRRKRDGLQTICRACQRLTYQRHVGALGAS